MATVALDAVVVHGTPDPRLDDVSIEVVPLPIDDLDVFFQTFLLDRVLGEAEAAGVVTTDQSRRFRADLEQAAEIDGFFAELAASGVRQVVLSPGSRSTPLALSADAAALEVTVQIDERVAAFCALGMGKATGVPLAIVRGLDYPDGEGRAAHLVRPAGEDLFR